MGRRNTKKSDAPALSEQLYEKIVSDIARGEAEKVALRRIEITGGDKVALGCKSSGWPEYQKTLRVKLAFLRDANLRRADEAAAALNRMGFKTGSGQQWTPRLVNVAKMLLLDAMKDRRVEPAANSGPARTAKPASRPRRPSAS